MPSGAKHASLLIAQCCSIGGHCLQQALQWLRKWQRARVSAGVDFSLLCTHQNFSQFSVPKNSKLVLVGQNWQNIGPFRLLCWWRDTQQFCWPSLNYCLVYCLVGTCTKICHDECTLLLCSCSSEISSALARKVLLKLRQGMKSFALPFKERSVLNIVPSSRQGFTSAIRKFCWSTLCVSFCMGAADNEVCKRLLGPSAAQVAKPTSNSKRCGWRAETFGIWLKSSNIFASSRMSLKVLWMTK